MNTIINSIWRFFAGIREAKYAADLARNGKWKEAQAIYKD